MAKTIGIDLGTTNSVVAFLEGSRIETIPNSEGSRLTPSAVYYKSDEEIVVGEYAKRQYLISPGRCVRSVKRIMGKRHDELHLDEEVLPFQVACLEDGMAGVQLDDGVMLRPEEVSADILDRLHSIAEEFLGDHVTQAVITVPAHFNDQQRTATKAAAELAGLEVMRIINEPTAAALAYGFGGDKNGIVGVFDFGGGTFDVSILQISGDIFEVLATNGDNHLGGDDIDQILFDRFCQGVVEQTGIDPRLDVRAVQRVREAAEKAKCELSTIKSTTVSLPFIVADAQGPKHFETILSRDQLNEMIEPLLERLFAPCRQALADANLRPDQIKEIILVGGSTRIPRVQERVAEFFAREPNHSVNPDEAVAVGAAIQSGVITGELREVLLIDVTPLTLGIELAGGVFKPLIPRNATIPCEASERFTTVVDNQSSVVVHVLQGERKKAAENHSLAKFRLVGIPPAPKELPEIEVRFSIDANGILSVTAMDLSSGQQTGVVVENYGDIGTRREVVERLVESAQQHQAEDEEFVRFSGRRQQAERLQSKANKVIAALGDQMSEEHVKALKEAMLRLDLAMESREESLMRQFEERIEDVIAFYEESEEFGRLIARHLHSQAEDIDYFEKQLLEQGPGAQVRLDESTATRRPPVEPTPAEEEDLPPPPPPPPPAEEEPSPVARGPWVPARRARPGAWVQPARPTPAPADNKDEDFHERDTPVSGGLRQPLGADPLDPRNDSGEEFDPTKAPPPPPPT